MEVISSSVDEETVEKLEFIQQNSSFDGRSELIRKAISDMYQETKRKTGFEGEISAAIFAQHSHESEHNISEISHNTEGIILTQLHNSLDEKTCLEIFLVQGEADSILGFYNDLNGSKATESVEMIPQF